MFYIILDIIKIFIWFKQIFLIFLIICFVFVYLNNFEFFMKWFIEYFIFRQVKNNILKMEVVLIYIFLVINGFYIVIENQVKYCLLNKISLIRVYVLLNKVDIIRKF